MVKEKHFNLLRNIRKHYHIFNTTVVAMMLIFTIYLLWGPWGPDEIFQS